MDNEKKPCCCCGTPAQPEAATAPAIDASAVPTESVTPSCCRHKDRTPEEHKAVGVYEVLRQWAFPELLDHGHLRDYEWK